MSIRERGGSGACLSPAAGRQDAKVVPGLAGCKGCRDGVGWGRLGENERRWVSWTLQRALGGLHSLVNGRDRRRSRPKDLEGGSA